MEVRRTYRRAEISGFEDTLVYIGNADTWQCCLSNLSCCPVPNCLAHLDWPWIVAPPRSGNLTVFLDLLPESGAFHVPTMPELREPRNSGTVAFTYKDGCNGIPFKG